MDNGYLTLKHTCILLLLSPLFYRYKKVKQDDNGIHIQFDSDSSAVLTYKPFRLDFMVANEVAVSVNSKGLINFEHYREKA
jgi:alpha 1,3-glucosidase